MEARSGSESSGGPESVSAVPLKRPPLMRHGHEGSMPCSFAQE